LLLAVLAFIALASAGLYAQSSLPASPLAELPVTKVALFSSGVAYFERRGTVNGDCVVSLPFASDEVNDALKSLIVAEGSASPSVSYPSRESLDRALKDFRIDLSGAPGVAELLSRLRGAEVEIDTPQTIGGRIVSIEHSPTKDPEVTKDSLVLFAKGGLRSFALDDIQAIRFADSGIGEDFERALGLILSSRDDKSRSLELALPGSGARQATVGYVIAAPVWKVSYRLDLSAAKPRIQGWAIVDNPTGQDWKDVSLSLVAGRPVSFIQDLYEPLYLERPTIPLAIAGIAAARSFDSSLTNVPEEADSNAETEAAPSAKKTMGAMIAPAPAMARSRDSSKEAQAAFGQALSAVPAFAESSAEAGGAGDQFQFTVKKPVSLERGKSAMLPLVSGEIAAERVSIFSPASSSGTQHPMLGAKLANSTGMRLPAGPISVFDGGLYAGDALLDFLPEKDSRLIAFGEDLGVTGAVTASSEEETIGVSIAKGVMTFSRRVTFSKGYEFKNGTAEDKKLVVEHPITQGAELFEPTTSEEKTASLYRFELALAAGGEAKLVVKERSPRNETVVLGSMRPEELLAYSSSQEIPQKVRDALKKAVDLQKRLEDAKRGLADQEARKESLEADQGRYRSNLDSVGRDSSQGQQYLKRLMEAEASIDQTSAAITSAQKAVQDAKAAYEGYLAELSI
jgi:hypothetical protein